MKIKPAILPHSFEEIAEKLTSLSGIASEIQIDLCDGIFGREKTWLPLGSEILPSGFSYEFDIMLNDWKTYIPNCILLGAKSIVAHVDFFSDEDILELVQMVAPHSIWLGIAVSNDKEISFHLDMIRKVQALYPHIFVQVMGIREIGEQGQLFDESVPTRIIEIKKSQGTIRVQVDGAMNPMNAPQVIKAGAESLVVGSYIFGEVDREEAYGKMCALEG